MSTSGAAVSEIGGEGWGERVCLEVSPGLLPAHHDPDTGGPVIRAWPALRPPAHRMDVIQQHKTEEQEMWGSNLTSALCELHDLGQVIETFLKEPQF